METYGLDPIQLQVLGSVALAMLLGALLGVERQLADRPAGLRTHMLVAGAAALFVGLGDILVLHFDAEMKHQILRTDPIRIIEAVITGVSFLGAGTIIRRDSTQHVEGLTTAASLLLAASVGICVALSKAGLGLGVTLFALIVLRALRRGEQWLGWRAE